MRVLVAIGLALTAYFLWWFATSNPVGSPVLFWLLVVSLAFKLLRMLHEWYHYVAISHPVVPAAAPPAYTVDMLTTACPGEPRDMIIATLRAMQAVTYPHTSYLCDEGDDPVLRAECARLGVVHVTRQHKINAKAGNINHALQQATGQLCVVLDPDHVPSPDFLDHVLPYFADPAVGYAQVVQAYGNQAESLIARGAAQQTYHFYGPLMMGMNTYNTAQAIGANCTFRREALDSIGGHAAGLTEDMHTAMRLHAAGWKSVYVPVIVSRGLVPATLAGYYSQQLKWSRGAFELLLHVYPRLFARFSWRQRIHYLTLPLYFFSGVVTLIDVSVPVTALLTLEYPWHLSLPEFALHLTPVLVLSLLIRYNAQRWLREPHEQGLHLTGGLLRISAWWVYLLGFVYTLLRVRVPYIPTPKDGELGNEWKLSLPNLIAAGICVGAARYNHYFTHTPYALLMMGMALTNASILLAAVLMGQHRLLGYFTRLLTGPRPGRRLLGWARNWTGRLWAALLWRVQTAALLMAALVFGAHALLTVGLQSWRNQKAPSTALVWARTGVGKVRVGVGAEDATTAAAGSAARPVLASYRSAGLEPTTAGLAEVFLPAVPTASGLQKALEPLDKQGSIPLLSWEVTDVVRPVAGWTPAIELIRRRNKPLLLRPLIKATNPTAYRTAWRQLVARFQATGDTSAVWVWTPNHPDSLAAYFPGAVYVDWVAVDCRQAAAQGASSAARYADWRLPLAQRAELSSKPILLLLPLPTQQTPHATTRHLISHYPEVKACIFDGASFLTAGR
ncbi:glycosyltransferase family 2 protein [Hymenobacter actinosclerus]|nr:cellulose synthase catalytic subunit [Hymenobacter actinosclerus]